jgi:hypothetical protein
VTVTATSQADTGKSASANVTINTPPAVSVNVTPGSATVTAGSETTTPFTAAVIGSVNQAVAWTLSGANCFEATCGTITTEGVYTAPAAPPSPDNHVTVSATSQADNTAVGTATITVGSVAGVVVSVSPSSTSTQEGGATPVQFTATVTGNANTAVTWSLSGSNCADETCGTITADGAYTPPVAAPNPDNRVTLVATSQADITASATATVFVTSPSAVQVTVSPGGMTLLPGAAPVQFNASVGDTAITTVTWSLTGVGAIDQDGLYSPPAALATTSTVLVTATSNSDGTTTGKAVVTVSGSDNQNTMLSGQYAFLFSGFDVDGPVTAAGSIIFDGTTGAITGLQDQRVENGETLLQLELQPESTYVVMPAAAGQANRGSMTLITSDSVYTYRFVLDSAGNGRLVEFDDSTGSGVQGTGVLKKQTASAFTLSALTGGYTFLAPSGDSPGATNLRHAVIGRFDLDGSGNFSNGLIDIAGTTNPLNEGGPATGLPTTAELGDTSSLETHGRFEAAFTPDGLEGSANFVFYVVSGTEFLIMNIDQPGDVQAFTGTVQAQSGPYNAASLPSTGVFNLTGYDLSQSETQAESNTTLGLLVTDGAGNISAGSVLDQTSDGAVVANTAITGTYTMEANGRGTLSFTAGPVTGTFIVYMYGTGSAFLMDASTGTENDTQTGTLEPQSGGPFSAASLVNSYTMGWLPSSNRDATGPNGSVTLDGVGAWMGTIDESKGDGNLQPNVTVGGTYTVAANGRGTLTVAIGDGEGGGGTEVFYLVSPSKGYMMSSSTDDSNSAVIVIEK